MSSNIYRSSNQVTPAIVRRKQSRRTRADKVHRFETAESTARSRAQTGFLAPISRREQVVDIKVQGNRGHNIVGFTAVQDSTCVVEDEA
jgi:hypothetical protein